MEEKKGMNVIKFLIIFVIIFVLLLVIFYIWYIHSPNYEEPVKVSRITEVQRSYFNSQFLVYEGTNTESQIKKLLQAVIRSNYEHQEDEDNEFFVTINNLVPTGIINLRRKFTL